VPMQVCTSRPPPQFPGGQLRNISRTGVLFHSEISFEIGTTLELPFRLPAENERKSSLPARLAVKTMRAGGIAGRSGAAFRNGPADGTH
jgi:hypothetical protein